MKRVGLHSLTFLLALGSLQQTVAQDLPKVIQPSPEAAALFKFQDWPMDHSTGLPTISIPLYEVKSGELKVPISISYHASGRKVFDRDGPIALGWSLNAGGMISRTIYGSVDFGTGAGAYKFPFPFVTGNLNNYNDIDYLQRIAHSTHDCEMGAWTDSEYDIFSYNFGNQSGKFFFKDANDVKTPVLLPYKPYVITPAYNVSPSPPFGMTGLTGFDMVDDEGTLYRFGASETYSTANGSAGSGWLLTLMVSADKTDSIIFSYTAKSDLRITISQTATLYDDWNFSNPDPGIPDPPLVGTEITSQEDYGISRLTQIKFKNGKMVFNLVSGSDKIDNIQVLNASNQVLKTIQFNRSLCYSQSELSYATNKLDVIQFKDNTGTTVENYSFEYYPLVSGNGQLNGRYQDWWGYYNNSGQHDFVPRYTNVTYTPAGGISSINVGNPLANRNPSLEPKKSGVLKKITYPTGGYSEFIYENNMCTLFGSVGTPISGPGLRISQIKSAANASDLPMIKTYKYGENESGYGAIELIPDMTSMSNEKHVGYLPAFTGQYTPEYQGQYRERVFLSSFISELSALADRPVIYTEVAEYNGTPASNTGKTIYKYDYTPWAASGMPTVVSGLTLHITQKHVYNWNYWKTPSLISKAEYKMIPAGPVNNYQKVKETFNIYNSTVTETVKGLHVQRLWTLPATGIGNATPPGGSTLIPVCPEKVAAWRQLIYGANIFTNSDYQVEAGYKNLTATTETIYPESGPSVSNTINYTYNAKQYQSSVTATKSDLSTSTTEFKYTFDYTGNAILTQMVNLNMLNFVVEQIENKNTTVPVKSVRTNYANFGIVHPMLIPQTVEAKTGSNAYETRIRYHAYDAEGNVTVVSKENDVQKVYIWGYTNIYPVAEVQGVSHSNAMALLNQSILQAPASDQALRDELNKIRQTYPTAQVLTFTYKPLIGITSRTETNGKVTFFEYDNHGRLILVKDTNGNIIKTFKYQYQGSSAN